MKPLKNKVLIKISLRLATVFEQQSKIQIGQTLLSLEKLAKKAVTDKTLQVDEILISHQLLFPKSPNASAKPYHRFNYRLMPDKTIKVGPVVGILIAGKERIGSPPTARRMRVYQELSETAADKNILLYFFYANDVDWQHRIVKGYVIQPRSDRTGWHKCVFCLPDIVYNRISYRFKEESETVQDFMNKAYQASIHVFNSRFLNKWEVHQKLFSNSRTRSFMPETVNYNDEALQQFLGKYDEFFIKPTGNSVGKGIIKIIVDQQIIRYYQIGKSLTWQTCYSHSELLRRLSIANDDKYILQQGIKLARLENRIFDIRAQVQKDGQGNWQLTGAAVRLAAVGQFVTHVPNGGSKKDYDLTIKAVFGSSPLIMREIDKQLSVISQDVPYVLEKSLNINLAILSIDIGVDQDGRMWIIEVNSKPASFDEKIIRKRHLHLLTDYFLFKTDFIIQSQSEA